MIYYAEMIHASKIIEYKISEQSYKSIIDKYSIFWIQSVADRYRILTIEDL